MTKPVRIPAETPISVTLTLAQWHRAYAVLRRGPFEDVADLLPEIAAHVDRRIVEVAAAVPVPDAASAVQGEQSERARAH